MIKKFISKVDGAEFEYKFNGTNLEIRSKGCDWSDFIPGDKRAYSNEEYKELITLSKKEKNRNSEDYCIECGCDLTHMDDGDDTCCWCLERIQKEKDYE